MIIFLSILIIFHVVFYYKYKENLANEKFLSKQNKFNFDLKEGFYNLKLGVYDSGGEITFNENGIICKNYGNNIGLRFSPVLIAQFLLSTNDKINALLHLNFVLDELVVLTDKQNYLVKYDFDWVYDEQKAPWYSSMAQGQLCSAFCRWYRLLDSEKYLESACKFIDAVEETNEENNFYLKLANSARWYKEYPNCKHSVLDGSLTMLAGIYDLSKISKQTKYINILHYGLNGFLNNWKIFKRPFGGVYYHSFEGRNNMNYYRYTHKLLNYLSTLNPVMFNQIIQDYKLPKYLLLRLYNYLIEGLKFRLGLTRHNLK
tara:strand:+ start:1751 stop:2698 length:948 start_codon:yes stop_codon:yes gene_type:complete